MPELKETAVKKVDAKSLLRTAKKPGTLMGLTSTQQVNVLSTMTSQIDKAAPSGIVAPRLIQQIATQLIKNPKLAECKVSTLVSSMMQIATLGLNPDLGHAYLIPYGQNVQMRIGYAGYIFMALNSGLVESIEAEPVFEGDRFEYEKGLNRKLLHIPNEDDSNQIPEKLLKMYAIVRYKGGGFNFIVISKDRVEELRLRSKMQGNKPSGAWGTDYIAMARAKTVKQLKAFLPLNIEMQDVLNSDGALIKEDVLSDNKTGIVKDKLIKEEDICDIDFEIIPQ